jgi:Flp pilus assembly protein TadG
MNVNSQKGAAVVEFAVILPLLLLILFGIVEFGFIFYDQALLTNASREGARRAIVYRTDSSNNRIIPSGDVEQAINDYLYSGSDLRLVSFGTDNLTASIDTDSGTTTLDPDLNPGTNIDISVTQGSYILVEVNYDYDFLLLPSIAGIPQTINLTGKTTMRAE